MEYGHCRTNPLILSTWCSVFVELKHRFSDKRGRVKQILIFSFFVMM